jgi:hypothetical protein
MGAKRKQYKIVFRNTRGDERIIVLRRANRQAAIDAARAHINLMWQGERDERWTLQSAKALGFGERSHQITR